MRTIELKCPLCCDQIFLNHESLKLHLLNIKLICPICQKTFMELPDLAEHIGRQCNDNEADNIIKQNVIVESTAVKNDEGNIEDSYINSGNVEPAQEDCNKEESSNDESVYHCSSCNINFTSIEEHLSKFHEGHQVFLESEKLEGDDLELPNNSVFIVGDKEEIDVEDAMSSSDLLDTIKEEEVLDKDGRLYTRKIVKIEKFWNESTNETAESVLELYQCSKCLNKFDDLEQYRRHKCVTNKSPDKNTTLKKCVTCNATFTNDFYLQMHTNSHKCKKTVSESDSTHTCEICNTEFNTYKSLRLHKRMHEPVKAKDVEPPVNYILLGEEFVPTETPREMFECEICNKPYDKEYEEAHKRSHNKNMDFNCETCNRKFFSQENLEMHMRAHVDSKKFICSHCKKGFLTIEKLEAHKLTQCQTRQYECQYCGRRFARPHEKVKHERIHTGEKPHICTICGKAFRVSYCLTLHMRTHSGTRPYKCHICSKRFKAHSVFNHHLLTHSEDRKFKCPFCPKSFKTGVQLAGHKNSHLKPFTCKKCQRPFASLYAARAHMETHDRQNNLKFDCELCGASYARVFALRDHMKEQHGDVYEDVAVPAIKDNNLLPETVILMDMENE